MNGLMWCVVAVTMLIPAGGKMTAVVVVVEGVKSTRLLLFGDFGSTS